MHNSSHFILTYKACFSWGHTIFPEFICLKSLHWNPASNRFTQQLLCLRQSLKLGDYESFIVLFFQAVSLSPAWGNVCTQQNVSTHKSSQTFKDLLCCSCFAVFPLFIKVTGNSVSLSRILPLQLLFNDGYPQCPSFTSICLPVAV